MRLETILENTIADLNAEVAELKQDENHYCPMGSGYNQSSRLLRTTYTLMDLEDTLRTFKSLMEQSDELPSNARGKS